MEKVDAVVVGAGVVGLATARALALKGRDVLVLEREDAIGTGVSSRNSEVIHAGIYYPERSLKAQLCVQGRDMLYGYAESHGVPFKRIGKLIVACDDEEIPALQKIMQKGLANGVNDLEMLGPSGVKGLERKVHAVVAVHSPSTGIIDSHQLMLAFQGDIENAGGVIAFGADVQSIKRGNDGLQLMIGGDNAMVLAANLVVNAAGLGVCGTGAIELAAATEGMDPNLVPTPFYAKGNYFSLSGAPPFARLIYPLPTKASLGCHATVDLGGKVKFGPDVEWIDRPDYEVDETRKELFLKSIRRYLPDIDGDDLYPDYAGVRPKIVGPDIGTTDFRIEGAGTHGIEGLVNLLGIESPGLTSSMAIGAYVAGMWG